MGAARSKGATNELKKYATSVSKWNEWGIQRELRLLRGLVLNRFLESLRTDIRLPAQSHASKVKPVTNEKNIIHSIPHNGLVIDTPGNYVLGNNVTWFPRVHAAAGTHAAILITCSDVSLNLEGHTIKCDKDTRPSAACLAIAVVPADDTLKPLQNIVLSNGSVENFYAYGIFVVGVQDVVLSGIGVRGLRNRDVTHTSIGLFIAACEKVRIHHCACKDSRVRSKAHSAVQVRFCTDVQIDNLEVANQHNSTGGNAGLAVVASRLVDVTRARIEDLTVGGALAPGSSGNTCLGVFLYLSAVLSVDAVRVKNVHGSCDDSHGISVFVCPQHVVISNCDVSNITTGFRSKDKTGAKATGIEVMVSADVHVHNCDVDNVSASMPQDLQVAGFSSGFTWRVNFEGCNALRCSVVTATGPGSSETYAGIGFGWAPDPRPMFVKPSVDTSFSHCTARRCDIGFDMFMHQNARINACTATKCKTVFKDDPDEIRTLSCNKCSECDPPAVYAVHNRSNDNIGMKGIQFREAI